ncbi:MAG: glycosyltransferase family 4 protein [Chloroflexi bacterium]|nr:MAG: glycosyltransferase family 4 protein [Chloroflexota bacterium]
MSRVGVFFASRPPDPRGPHRDHLEFCRATGAELVCLEPKVPPALKRRLRLRHPLIGMWMAWSIFRVRRRYDVLITDSEHVGLPLALMLRVSRSRCRHVLVVHLVSTPLKAFFIRYLAGRGVSCYVYHFPSAEPVLERLGVPPERRRFVPYMVDSEFWSPVDVPQKRQICAVGLEYRDYPTLLEAVRGVDVAVDIAAGSPWSQKADGTHRAELPPNVRVGRRDYAELRQLYAESLFTVVPLLENEMQAGITTIVESMAMGRPVVVSRTRGQVGTVRDSHNGLEVPPGDVAALRRAIHWLLDHPEECRRMGAEGRHTIESGMTLGHFVERMSAVVATVSDPGPRLASGVTPEAAR